MIDCYFIVLKKICNVLLYYYINIDQTDKANDVFAYVEGDDCR